MIFSVSVRRCLMETFFIIDVMAFSLIDFFYIKKRSLFSLVDVKFVYLCA